MEHSTDPEGQGMVFPGMQLGVEEEYVPSDNTYVENGIIYAAAPGRVSVSDGRLSVGGFVHEIRPVGKGMYVVGTVTDDVRAVVFVKIDNVKSGGMEYVATRDGKIVMQQPRAGGRPQGMHHRHEDGRPQREEAKPCQVGDVVLAKVLNDDPEVYTLGIREEFAGVVSAECASCGAHMEQRGESSLYCASCRRAEPRKVSPFYDKPEQVRSLFA